MAEFRKQTIRDYGRPYVDPVVKAAANNVASEHKILLKAALEALIDAVGSYDELLVRLSKEARRTRTKHKRQRAIASTGNVLPRGAIYKIVRIFLGGGPGLGGVRKPIQTKST